MVGGLPKKKKVQISDSSQFHELPFFLYFLFALWYLHLNDYSLFFAFTKVTFC